MQAATRARIAPTRERFPMTHAQARLAIHACVVLWGFTAILGKLITLPAAALVFWRMLGVAALLLLVPRVWLALRAWPARLTAIYAGIGALVAAHWVTFYASIKLANASVAATCMALAPVFVAMIEPRLAGRRFEPRELALAVAVVPGVALVVGGMPGHMLAGLAVGALSALLVAVFGVLNKRWIGDSDAFAVTAVEMAAGMAVIALLMPLFADGPPWQRPDGRDAVLLGVLIVACTLVPFVLSLVALRQLTAFEAQLAVNLEPVYAIALAIVLLGEQRELGLAFYVGVLIVVGAVFAQPLIQRKSG
jgi:drug/metabolite transporter (DMT)-like permease